MKKYMLFFIILITVASLAACSAVSAVPGSDGKLNTSYANALPVQSQLAAGTLKLEGTQNAVTKAQAPQLLVLWKAIRTLSSVSSTSPAEISAVVDQIQETMTPEQVKAITDFKLSQDSVAEIMQGIGSSFRVDATPQPNTTRVAGNNGRPQGNFGGPGGGGGMPPGGFDGGGAQPGGGGGFGGLNATPNASTQATAQARRGANGGATNTALINIVITFLEKRAAE